MNSAGGTVSDSPTPANLFDEFVEAFQNCLAPLTKEDPLNGINQDELRVNAETNGHRFLELAHRMDAAFLQKRLLLSVQKPELLLSEENQEMLMEINRKDDLIKKHTEKLAEWQNTLMNLTNRDRSVPFHGGAAPRPPTVGGPGLPPPNVPPSHISMLSGGRVQSSGQAPMAGGPPQSATMNMVGGMSHGAPNMSPHSMGSSVSMSHQPMMGQGQGSGNTSSMAPMNQGGYQPMNNMSGSGPGPGSIHGGSMGGTPPSSMGATQGPGGMNVGPGNINSNMGSGPTGGPAGGGIYSHGTGPAMGGMGPSQGGLQGPLAFLEKTTTNIGMPEPNRR